MPSAPLRRAYAALRRLLRRRRAPGASEQMWLRLILLVRRLQRGQLAFAQRLDEIRVLSGALGAFRSDFGALHEQLGATRVTAGELERGLSERLQKLDARTGVGEERAALDQRLGALDALLARLERLAGQAPASTQHANELGALLARFGELAERLESVQESARAAGGQEELAQLYERIQELAEGLALRAPTRARGEARVDHEPADLTAGLEERIDQLSAAVEALGASGTFSTHEETLARLERVARRLESRPKKRGADPDTSAEELIPLVARFESLALRMEQASPLLPELPPETLGIDPVAARELEELRVQWLCEQESRRRIESELEAQRERLRASELARVELETRHSTELAQMADHVGRQLQRVEEDLKKKKRGMAELTQQNIALQNQLARLQGEAGARSASEPPAPLPRPAVRPEAKVEGPPPE